MIETEGRIVWRVRAADGSAHESAFDALVTGRDRDGDGVRRSFSERLLAQAVPYEAGAPFMPLVFVVRAHPEAGPITVEVEAFGPDGQRRFLGRSSHPLAVMICSMSGISVSGLPGVMPGEPAST